MGVYEEFVSIKSMQVLIVQNERKEKASSINLLASIRGRWSLWGFSITFLTCIFNKIIKIGDDTRKNSETLTASGTANQFSVSAFLKHFFA